MTRYIDVNDLSELVLHKGLTTCLAEMAECIREDYLRWHEFDKCARLAYHSKEGVIELMPVSDASLYAFKASGTTRRETAMRLRGPRQSQ
nr:hypothetical protein [Pseudomonas mohnii]